MTGARLILRSPWFGEFSPLLNEGLIILGWVANWRPIEIFLYDWWPILAERKLYDRLSVMPVSVTFRPKLSAVDSAVD